MSFPSSSTIACACGLPMTSMRAGSVLAFRKECGTPRGTNANPPADTVSVTSAMENSSCPSTMYQASSYERWM